MSTVSIRPAITNADTGETTVWDSNWDDIRSFRNGYLIQTDIWMLNDRYNSLSSERKTEITNFREALRNLPTVYYDETKDFNGANDAADNFPAPPTWL